VHSLNELRRSEGVPVKALEMVSSGAFLEPGWPLDC
jgi:hypothetical protein